MANVNYSNDERRYGIQKLSSTNYHVWKQKMELLLIREGLWTVIDKPTPDPPDDTWINKDNIARSTIGLLVEDKYLVDIRHARTAKDLWHRLEKLLQRDNIGSRLILYRRMFTAKYTGDTSIPDHISTILDTAARLEDMGYPVIQEVLCSAILGSLPKEFNSVITAIESRNSDDITVDYVREKLTEEGERLRANSPHHTRAMKTDKRQFTKNQFSTTECFYCHKRGHIKRDCRLLKEHQSHHSMQGKRSHKNFNYKKNLNSDKTKLTSTFEDDEEEKDLDRPTRTHLTTNHKAMINKTGSKAAQSTQWVVDTGAGSHMCNDVKHMTDLHELEHPTVIYTASGEEHKVTQAGTSYITVTDEKHNSTVLKLNDVLLVTQLTDNLISVAKLDNEGYEIFFKTQKCWIIQEGKNYEMGRLIDGLYIAKTEPKKEAAAVYKHIWHQRLAHRNTENISRMAESKQCKGLQITQCLSENLCSICQLTKKHQTSFKPIKERKADRPFHTLHADLCGPITPQTAGNNNYALSVLDDYSRFATIYLIKHKDQATQKIKEFIEAGINKFNRRPIIFRSDGGGEFDNKLLGEYLASKGIKHRKSLPHVHQQNGLIERHNRTLMEGTRALLKQSKLPKTMWGEMANTYTYLNNLVTKSDQEKPPYQLWNNQPPDYEHLRTIGNKCYFLNTKPCKMKLDDRGKEGILVGYGHSTGFYRILSLEDNRIYISRTVTFLEDTCPNQVEMLFSETKSAEEKPKQITLLQEDKPDAPDESTETNLRKSERHNKGNPPHILTYGQSGKPENQIRDWHNDHRHYETPEIYQDKS